MVVLEKHLKELEALMIDSRLLPGELDSEEKTGGREKEREEEEKERKREGGTSKVLF